MIPLFKPFVSQEARELANRTLSSGFIGQGPRVEEFEKELKKVLKHDRILTFNSCTSALMMALYLSEGKEVVSTPMTCAATNTAILRSGKKVRWADVDPFTGMIQLKKDCDIVMGVMWAGQRAGLKDLRKHAKTVIVDAAQGFMTDIDFDFDFLCYSFQAVKQLTCVDGGALVCKREEDHQRAKKLRWYGMDRPVDLSKDVPEPGWKWHMNDLNASLGLGNLPYMAVHKGIRQRNAEILSERGVFRHLDPGVNWPFFHVLVKEKNKFMRFMADRGIQTGPVHRRNDLYSMFPKPKTALEGVEFFDSRQFNVPCGWWVTPEEAKQIAGAIMEYGDAVGQGFL